MHIRLSFDRGTLVLEGAPPERIDRLFKGSLGRWDPRISAWRCEAYLYGEIRTRLQGTFDRALVDVVPLPMPLTFPRIDLPVKDPEQHRGLSAWIEAGHRGVIVPADTDKGKETGLHAVARMKTAALIVTTDRNAVFSWHQRILRAFRYDAGVLIGDQMEARPLTVTTYRKASIHMDELGASFGLVVFDQAMLLAHKYHREAALMSTAPHRLGLLSDMDGSEDRQAELTRLVGPTVYWMKPCSLTHEEKAHPSVNRLSASFREDERRLFKKAKEQIIEYIESRRKEDEGYTWLDLRHDPGRDPETRRAQEAYFRMKSIEDQAEGIMDALEEIFERHKGERLIVFVGSDDAAMKISRRFLVPALCGHTRKPERLAFLKGFAQGLFPVLISTRMPPDDPSALPTAAAVAMGGAASLRRAGQYLGRNRDGFPGSLYEIILDAEE